MNNKPFIVSAHQPNLFPNDGFWKKMKDSDIFEIAIYDQFSTKMFVGKVNLGDDRDFEKFKMPCRVHKHGQDRICDIKLKEGYQHELWDAIVASYYQYPKYGVYAPFIQEMILGTIFRYLWEFNLHVILSLKDLLGIDTPITIGTQPPLKGKTEDIIWMVKKYNGNAYLSGISGKYYLEADLFDKHHLELQYFQKPARKVSVLTNIFKGDYLNEK